MRKITQQAIDAFMGGHNFKSGNTEVISHGSGANLYLHGNLIAINNGVIGIIISAAGWPTSTTKERLNGIPGVSINQKNGEWFLNGKKWNGEWIKI